VAVYTKRWSGSAWVTAPFKKWNGSAWVDAYVWKWNGSTWVQLYPETMTTTTQTLSSTTFATYRGGSSDYWTGNNRAKQGPWSSYGNAYGYLGVSSWNLPGCGQIYSISSGNISGGRGGAGYYNNNQTIHFYRSSAVPNTKPTDIAGEFTTTTGAPGKNGYMSGRALQNTDGDLRDWVNAINGKPYLWIYTSIGDDYLSIESSFSISLSYTYLATTALFEEASAIPAVLSIDGSMPKTNNYHTMPIYLDEVNMTLDEIMKRREDGVVKEIDPSNVFTINDINPWLRERKVFEEDGITKFKIEAMNMTMTTQVQYSLDNIKWDVLYGTGEGDYVQTDLPPDFNRYKDNIYIRIVDIEKELLITSLVVEPTILINQ
jgi:hypothetical protein